MHFTRRRLDRPGSALVVAASLLVVAGVVASCSSSDGGDEATEPKPVDASSEAQSDAGSDARPPLHEAGLVDAAPLPVVCASARCATALVTTLGPDAYDRGEGFCALLGDGTVACWGANAGGQLGRGEEAGTLDSSNVERVPGLSDIVKLDHTCAIDKNGAVWCWGTGPFLRDEFGGVTTERTPVKLDLPPSMAIGVSYVTACAAASDGVRCWGNNSDAQLSPPSQTSEYMGPPRLIPVPSGAPVRALGVGRATFVLREDGTLVTWGANPPIGRVSPFFPDPYPQDVDVRGISMVDLAYDNACATGGGTGYCWGAPIESEGAPTDRALPEPVVAPEPIVQIATSRPYRISELGAQRYRWCAAGVSGNAYCWGFNGSGQVGDGTQDYAYDATKVRGLVEPVADVKVTPSATCALLTNGKIYCWGSNYNGQLGNGESRGRSLVPVEVVLP